MSRVASRMMSIAFGIRKYLVRAVTLAVSVCLTGNYTHRQDARLTPTAQDLRLRIIRTGR